MIGRLAFRSLTAHPVRSAVLAAGFGVGVAVMAILLGVAEVVLDQARAPALVGGGDVRDSAGAAGAGASPALRHAAVECAPRSRAGGGALGHGAALPRPRRAHQPGPGARRASPASSARSATAKRQRVAAWRDSPDDVAWTQNAPENVLRAIDRFHPVPDAPAWASSWAEWLYFNGRAEDARFYLTFLVGPRVEEGRRSAGVRLQLERRGHVENFNGSAAISEAEALRAPDLTIGAAACGSTACATVFTSTCAGVTAAP